MIIQNKIPLGRKLVQRSGTKLIDKSRILTAFDVKFSMQISDNQAFLVKMNAIDNSVSNRLISAYYTGYWQINYLLRRKN